MIPVIPFEEGEARLDWLELTDALAKGHELPKAEIGDTYLYRGDDTILNRSAWIDGMGIAVKSATVFPGNPQQGKAVVNGGVTLYSDSDGTPQAIVDFHLLTKWKTAGDSLLAARKLARPDSRNILIMGAGTVGHSLVEAYRAGFPEAEFTVWNRTAVRAQAMAERFGIDWVEDLQAAVGNADIIGCATMSTAPVLMGDWLQPGQHVDLIGAYRPDMREADDTAMSRSRVFVDSFATTIEHIGEIKDPLERGVISRGDLLADFYDLEAFDRTPTDITLCKNGGGAHLDLMTARYILERWHG